MLLRSHPLMSYKGKPSWPPPWYWIDGLEDERPQGEVGTLLAVHPCTIEPVDRCYLYIVHRKSFYIGLLLINDPTFCRQITKLLQGQWGRAIEEIGNLDLSYTL
jgi:hypothetical protein